MFSRGDVSILKSEISECCNGRENREELYLEVQEWKLRKFLSQTLDDENDDPEKSEIKIKGKRFLTLFYFYFFYRISLSSQKISKLPQFVLHTITLIRIFW